MRLDAAKGIAILAVVAGHYLQSFAPGYMNFAYCFHMPLFFLIGGYLLKADKSFKDFAAGRAKRLLIPYIVTAVVWDMLMTLKAFVKKGTYDAIKQFIKCSYAIFFGGGQGKGSFYLTSSFEWKFVSCEIGMLWFLLALLWGSLIVYGTIRISSKKVQIFLIVVISVGGYFSSGFVTLPLSVQQGMLAASFLYIGYYARKINAVAYIKNNVFCSAMCMGGFILWLVMGKFSMLKMYCNFFKWGIADWIASIIICCAVVIVSQFLFGNKTNVLGRLTIWFGENSLYILCIHFIDVTVFGFIMRKMISLVVTERITVAVLSVALSTVWYCMLIVMDKKVIGSRT